jgi:hypothetical protein
MNIVRRQTLALAMAGGAAISSYGLAQDSDGSVRFAAPKRIQAGGAFLGEGRLYPSPVLHDIDGDGRADVVVGDLFGRVTVAHRSSDRSFSSEEKLKAKNGKELKFHNW